MHSGATNGAVHIRAWGDVCLTYLGAEVWGPALTGSQLPRCFAKHLHPATEDPLSLCPMGLICISLTTGMLERLFGSFLTICIYVFAEISIQTLCPF